MSKFEKTILVNRKIHKALKRIALDRDSTIQDETERFLTKEIEIYYDNILKEDNIE